MRFDSLDITLFFKAVDLWIGLYIDRPGRCMYICPVPMFGVKISFGSKRAEPMKLKIEMERADILEACRQWLQANRGLRVTGADKFFDDQHEELNNLSFEAEVESSPSEQTTLSGLPRFNSVTAQSGQSQGINKPAHP